MSGTDEFGTEQFGAGEFDRASGESGAPGRRGPLGSVPLNNAAAANNVTALRPGRAGGPVNQGPGFPGGQGRGGVPPQGGAQQQGAGAGAPWLAGGAVPYAEAMFGGQEAGGAGRGQRGPGVGPNGGPVRRSIPEQQQGQAPQQPQQPQPQMPHGQPEAGAGYGAPGAPGPAAGREGYERYANGYGPGPAQRFEPGPYDAAPQQPRFESPAGFDAPTTEFFPGPMFDEPVVPPQGAQHPGAAPAPNSPAANNAALNNPLANNAVNSGVAAAAANGVRPDPLSASGAWTAEPVNAAAAAPAPAAAGPLRTEPQQRAESGYGSGSLPRPPMPDEPVPGPPPLPTRPARTGRTPARGTPLPADRGGAVHTPPQGTPLPDRAPTGQTPTPPQGPSLPPDRGAPVDASGQGSQFTPEQGVGGTGQVPLPDAAPSAQPRAAAEDPAAGREQSAPHPLFSPPQRDPQPGEPSAPAQQQAHPGTRETLMPPRRTAAQQPRVPSQPQAPVAPAGAAAATAPPTPQAAPQTGSPSAPRPPEQQKPDDLASERLRSVAPLPQRTVSPEVAAARAQAGAAPHATGTFADLAEQEPQEATERGGDADELIVPWQAAPAPGLEAQAGQGAAAGAHPGSVQDPASAQQPAATAQATSAAPQAQVPAPRGTRRRVAEPAAVPAGTQAAAAVPGNTQTGQTGTSQAGVAATTGAQAAAAAQPTRAVDPAQPQQPSGAPGQQPRASAQAAAPAQTQPDRAAAQPQAPGRPAEPAAEPAPGPRARSRAAQRAHEPAAAPEVDERAPAYDEDALAAVYRVIHERRDVRNDFVPDEVPTEVLTRILEAAHTAPSVGFSQPWDFLVIRDAGMRQTVHDLAVRQRRAYAASLPKARARAFASLKIEAILDTPVNIVVTCDPTRGGRHTLGRYTQPSMAPFSSCLAVENLWLAARAEGLGVGWVSFFDERELAAVLDLPAHLQVVAYLCVGYVKRFPPEPELAGAGWAKRRPLAWAVHEEKFGHRALPGEDPVSLLSETVDAIRGLDPQALAAARDRQARMTKPPGSLGTLEAVAEQLAGLAGVCPPPLPEPAALAVFAGDHGVHAQGVTPWPQEVTAQMVANFLAGGAVVNAFAKQVGAEVCVVDIGVNADIKPQSGLIPRKIRYGTADMTQGPALTREEVTAALEAGIETARDLVAAGNKCLLTGDMGITNTTASAALIAAFTGASPAQVTGYGTGIDEQTYAHKVEVVRRALELHRPDPHDPVGVLAAFGGLEHAALAGFILGACALRVPVVLDGVIAGAAALVAQAFSADVTAACVAGHRSAEPGHALALEALGVVPLIDLELRLGEGSGAALALPLVAAAVRALREVATFDDAGVADASEASVMPPRDRG